MAETKEPETTSTSRRPHFCGRAVSDDEWEVLLQILGTYRLLSRHELAATVCEAVGWVRANGRLKTRECYEYLELLESRGLVSLPARQQQRPRGPTSIRYTDVGEERPQREGTLSDVSPVTLSLVSNGEDRALWRELIQRYHYLGHKVAYGAHLRYLVLIDGSRRELGGCVQFSSAARWLVSRDRFIGWDEPARQSNLQQVINNSRFLILPWLKVKGLASHVLSLAARVVVDDWEEAYGIRPVLLETFVEQQRHEGTCYLAANWIEVGTTAGRGRMDRQGKATEPPKRCLVYPLTRDFRRRLGAAR